VKKKMSAFIMAITAYVALIYGLLFGPFSMCSSILYITSKNVWVDWDSFIGSFCSIIFIYVGIVHCILGDDFVFLLFLEFHNLCCWTEIYYATWLAIP